jgi:prepilin-type processing-associated H-X9-DG protein
MYSGWGTASATSPPANWLFNPNNPSVGTPVTNFKTQFVHTGLMWPWLRSENAFRCPLDDKTWSSASVQFITSYVANGAFCAYTPSRRLHLRQFHAEDVVFWELPAYSTTGKISVNDPSNYPPEGVTCRHLSGAWNGQGNAQNSSGATTVGYVDGHAAMMSDSEFNTECQAGPSHLWCDPTAPKDGGASKWGGGILNPIPTYY